MWVCLGILGALRNDADVQFRLRRSMAAFSLVDRGCDRCAFRGRPERCSNSSPGSSLRQLRLAAAFLVSRLRTSSGTIEISGLGEGTDAEAADGVAGAVGLDELDAEFRRLFESDRSGETEFRRGDPCRIRGQWPSRCRLCLPWCCHRGRSVPE